MICDPTSGREPEIERSEPLQRRWPINAISSAIHRNGLYRYAFSALALLGAGAAMRRHIAGDLPVLDLFAWVMACAYITLDLWWEGES